MKLSILLTLIISTSAFAISGDIPPKYEVEKQLQKLADDERKPSSISDKDEQHTQKFKWKKHHDGPNYRQRRLGTQGKQNEK